MTPPPTNTPMPTPTPTPSCVYTWTMLLYLVGDYNDNGSLALDYQETLERLENVNNPCVRFAIQIDGPRSIPEATNTSVEPDTYRYLIESGKPIQSIGFGEQAMDDSETLVQFIEWGQSILPADHYYLAIANHGQGVVGIGWDLTRTYPDLRGEIYLTPAEIAKALNDERVAPIDILHLDACSMDTLEVLYQLRHTVKYVIASQYLAWNFFAYDDYARQIGISTTERQLAASVVDRYAAHGNAAKVPFTISALDLASIDEVKRAVDNLAVVLKAWVTFDPSGENRQHLLDLRYKSQTFDSNGDAQNTASDIYVDILNWASTVQNDATFNEAIRTTSAQLGGVLQGTATSQPFILHKAKESYPLPTRYVGGAYVDLQQANGLSIYFPLEKDVPPSNSANLAVSANTQPSYSILYRDYINNTLFDFTLASRWDEFLAVTLGVPAPNEQLAPIPSPLAPVDAPAWLYLPVVIK
jgi:hypothetical protein